MNTPRRRFLCLVGVGCGVGAGCSRFANLGHQETDPSYRWQTDFEDHELRTAVITPDYLVLTGETESGHHDGKLQAIDRQTGERAWSVSIPEQPTSLIAHGERIYVTGWLQTETHDDGRLHAVAQTDGTRLWTYRTNRPLHVRPSVGTESVYVRSDRRLHAVTPVGGEQRWSVDIPAGRLGPVAAANRIYLGNADHTVRAYTATGESIWTVDTEWSLTTRPTTTADTVYIGSSDERLYALNRGAGTVRWRFRTGNVISARPVVRDGTVYVGSADYYVYALDPAGETKRWRFETNAAVDLVGRGGGTPIYAVSGRVDRRATVFALTASGTLQWRLSPANARDVRAVLIDQDTLYLVWLTRIAALPLAEARQLGGTP